MPGWLNVLCRMARDGIHLSRPDMLAGIVRDVSKRIQEEQNLHQRAETRTHEQATLLQISHTLASTLEFQPGLILDQLGEIIKYTHGGLFALEDSTLVTLAMRGTPQLEQSSPFRIHLQGRKPWLRCSTGTGPSASRTCGVTIRRRNFCVRFWTMGLLCCSKGCSRGCGYRWR